MNKEWNAPRPYLLLWTIYGPNTTDLPGHYVVRRFEIARDGPRAAPYGCVCATLEEARRNVPPGLVCFTRDPRDEPQIVETWL